MLQFNRWFISFQPPKWCRLTCPAISKSHILQSLLGAMARVIYHSQTTSTCWIMHRASTVFPLLCWLMIVVQSNIYIRNLPSITKHMAKPGLPGSATPTTLTILAHSCQLMSPIAIYTVVPKITLHQPVSTVFYPFFTIIHHHHDSSFTITSHTKQPGVVSLRCQLPSGKMASLEWKPQ